MGGVTQEHKKPVKSPKRCKIVLRLLLRTNTKSYTRFRLVPKSVFKYPLLSKERVKLRTSNLVCTFSWSMGTKGPLKILEILQSF